jgi:cyclase
MNRRHFVISSTAAVAGLALGRVSARAQAPATPPAPLVTAFTELRRGVGVFTASGGTIGYLLNGDGAVAVDSQYMNNAEICVAGLKQRSPKGIAMLLNTHHHADHTGGNLAFRSSVQKIVAHEACAAWHRKTAEQAGTQAQQAFADTTFAESWKADFGDETVHARYYGAGHTSGDAVITFEKANVVHMGDLLFNRAHPNIDRPAGANLANWIRVLGQASDAASSDTLFIAGHAKEMMVKTTKADVAHFANYLTAVLDHARKSMRAGQSKDALQKTATLPGFEDTIQLNPRLSLGFVLGIAFDELNERM